MNLAHAIRNLRTRRQRETAEVKIALNLVLKHYQETTDGSESDKVIFNSCDGSWREICANLNKKFKRIRANPDAFKNMVNG